MDTLGPTISLLIIKSGLIFQVRLYGYILKGCVGTLVCSCPHFQVSTLTCSTVLLQ